MKIFNENWAELLPVLDSWKLLSEEAQYLLMEGENLQKRFLLSDHLFDDLVTMQEAGVVAQTSPGKWDFTDPLGENFRRTIRQMKERQVFSGNMSSENPLGQYLNVLLHHEDVIALGQKTEFTGYPDQQQWMDSFLQASDRLEWESGLHGMNRMEASGGNPVVRWNRYQLKPKFYFPNVRVQALAGELVKMAKSSPEPVPMANLEPLAKEDPAIFNQAFKACIRYALLFPGLDPLHRPVFWVWPELGRRLHRPRARRPQPVETEPFDFQWNFLTDASTILNIAAREPIPVKKSGYREIFAKAKEELRRSLLPASKLTEDDLFDADEMVRFPEFDDRLDFAVQWLEYFKFLRYGAEEKSQLEITPAGLEFLKQPFALRCQQTVNSLRASFGHELDLMKASEPHFCFEAEILFGRKYGRGYLPTKPIETASWLMRVWSKAEPGEFYNLQRWVEFFSREDTPDSWEDFFYVGAYPPLKPRERHQESILSQALYAFFSHRLLPLGLVRLGLDKSRELCFSVRPEIFVLLDGIGKISTMSEPSEVGQVIVQPDFEIIFLGANAEAYIELMPLAERLSQPPGKVFRLTRESILQAVKNGWSAENLLAVLEKWSQKTLPSNVRSQIQDWAASCRTVFYDSVLLLRISDEATAQQVQQDLGKKCEFLAPGLLALEADSIPTEKLRKWKKQGIFVQKTKTW